MWSYVICLALLAPAVFARNAVTLEELKRTLTSYLDERDGLDLGGLSFEDGTRDDDAPLIGGGGAGAESDIDVGNLFPGAGAGAGARSGPMAQLDMRSLFGSHAAKDSYARAERLLGAIKEAEAAVAAGTYQMRERSRSKRGTHTYTLCVFCDDMCLNQIAGAGYDTDSYFDVITADMNTMLQTLDAGSLFDLSFKLIPGSPIYMDWFADSSLTGEDLLTAINDAFWDGTGLYGMANSYGCDVDFLMASSDDPAWSNMGSVEGIANMMQLCQMSFSTVKMSNNPASTATLMSHEFGHMIGAYHDGPLDSAYTSLASYFAAGGMLSMCGGEYDSLAAECTGSTPSGYIMDSVVSGASEYSSCSIAYFNMFLCLSDVMPQYYSVACV